MFRWINIKKSLLIGLWIALVTFPMAVIRVNTIENSVTWRWHFLPFFFAGAFAVSLLWNWALARKNQETEAPLFSSPLLGGLVRRLTETLASLRAAQRKKWEAVKSENPRKAVLIRYLLWGVLGLIILAFPFAASFYRVNVMLTVLIYIILALGLNIVVGLGGILHLGHAAFFAIGAYTYALLNVHFGVNFWLALPLGGITALIFGLILSVTILRLSGDYLAIITLAFCEIVRIVLENWNDFSFGPGGIANIPRPALPGIELNLIQTTQLTYFIMILITFLVILVTRRLTNSRLGRALIAMREDEIACQTMGINTRMMKVTAFALGSFLAGVAGVLFAAKTTFINPASFRVWESVIILCIVILGGRGSILGVTVGAFIIIQLPEELRAFSEYRMLLFGSILVIMMIFKPEGIIPEKRKHYKLKEEPAENGISGSPGDTHE